MKEELLRHEFVKLEAFLDFYLREGSFTIDILNLINLIDSQFPDLSWMVYDWKRILVRTEPRLNNVILLLEDDEFRNIKFKGVYFDHIGLQFDSPKLLSSDIDSDYFFKKGCKTGKIKIVKYLYENSNLDLSFKYCFANNIEQLEHLGIVQFLYSIGCDPKVQNNFAIRCASSLGYLEVVKYLYSVGCDPTDWGNWAIRWASRNGRLEVVKYLYEVAGCDPTAKDNHAIIWAASNGHLEVVKYLYEEAGCNNPRDIAVGIRQAAVYNSLEFVKYFYENTSLITNTNMNNSILSEVVSRGYLELTKYLIEDLKLDLTILDNYSIKQAVWCLKDESMLNYLKSLGCKY